MYKVHKYIRNIWFILLIIFVAYNPMTVLAKTATATPSPTIVPDTIPEVVGGGAITQNTNEQAEAAKKNNKTKKNYDSWQKYVQDVYSSTGYDEEFIQKVKAYIKDEGYKDRDPSLDIAKALKKYNNGNDTSINLIMDYAKEYIDKGGAFDTSTGTYIADINESESMAAGEMYAQQEKIKTKYNLAKSSNTSWIEKELSGLLISIADWANDLLSKVDATIDHLVYGRILFYGTNYYSFELVKGNPYGIVGSYMYKLLRNIAIPMLFLMVMYQFVKSAWSSGSGEKRREFKNAVMRAVILLLFLFLMPTVLDSLIALKDVVLHYIYTTFGSDMASLFGVENKGDTTLSGFYRSSATSSNKFMDAVLYLAATGISVFYFFTYISTAVATMLLYVFFPVVCIMSISDSKLTGGWSKIVIGNVLNPIMDSILLLLPLLVKKLCGDNELKAYLITIIVAYSIIPGKALVRSVLGIAGSARSEMLGLGSMFAAGRMLSGLKRKATSLGSEVGSKFKEAKQNNEKANMYADLARATGEGDQLTGRFSSLGKMSFEEDDDKHGKLLENENGMLDNEQGNSFAEAGMNAGLSSPLPSMKVTEKDDEGENALQENNDINAANGENNINDDMNVLQSEDFVNGNENAEQLNALNVTANGNSNSDVSNNQNEAIMKNDAEQISTEQMSTEQASEQQGNVDAEGMSVKSGTADVASGTLESIQKSKQGNSAKKRRQVTPNDVYRNYATTDNFQEPEFANVFNFAERAQLHKQRANRLMLQGVGKAVGGAGGITGSVVGATVAGSATMFSGASTNILATTVGANVGASIGSSVGNAVGSAGAAIYSSDIMHQKPRKAIQKINSALPVEIPVNNYDGYYSNKLHNVSVSDIPEANNENIPNKNSGVTIEYKENVPTDTVVQEMASSGTSHNTYEIPDVEVERIEDVLSAFRTGEFASSSVEWVESAFDESNHVLEDYANSKNYRIGSLTQEQANELRRKKIEFQAQAIANAFAAERIGDELSIDDAKNIGEMQKTIEQYILNKLL